MSFICYNCKKGTQDKEPANKVIIKSRPKIYSQNHKDKTGHVTTTQTTGTEIVKEVMLCKACFERR